MFKDVKEYVKGCDVSQVGNPFRQDKLPLHLVKALYPFEKWEVDFIGPIKPHARHFKDLYIITALDYLTRWENVTPTQYYSINITTWSIFENIIFKFGCPRSLMSDQGHHFLSSTIVNINQELQI
jgi:hypothetical protein